MITIIHTAFSIIALLAGVIFLIPKGTQKHKRLGYIYLVSMLISLTTSFGLFSLWGEFGVYHALTIISFITLAIAMYFPIAGRKKTNWVELHLLWMGYSYIGLVIAAGSHLFMIVPEWPNYLRVGLFWVLPYVLGTTIIVRRKVPAASEAVKNIGKQK